MFRFIFSLFLIIPGIIYSQVSDSAKKAIPPVLIDSVSDHIISGPKNYVIANSVIISGNKVTKEHIILREVPFSKGDTLYKSDISELVRSIKENLLNTSLFNFVRVDTLMDISGRADFFINVAERWYTWPVPIFEVQERNFNTWWQTRNFDRANYGFFLNRENFRGRKEELSFYAQFGYTEKFGLSYTVPYLTHKQNSGAGLSFSYSRNREVAYGTQNNVLVYFKNPDEYVRKELTSKLYYTYRKGIHRKHYFEGKFVEGLIDDTLKNYTSDYFVNNNTEMNYFVMDYSFRCDYRDSKQYPLRGYFWEFEATKIGIGILKDEKIDVINLFLTLRDYEKLSNRVYLACGLKIKFSPNKYQPYYVQRGLGWRDYVRGYEYYVIDGQSYVTAKTGLKFEIIKPKVQTIPYMPLKKFNTFHYALYAGFFADAGYVDDQLYSLNNQLSNSFLFGYGVGIDYVTYYDIVLRMEYSFNKMLEHGFFLHFNAGI